jgi:hypothetical protein
MTHEVSQLGQVKSDNFFGSLALQLLAAARLATHFGHALSMTCVVFGA